MKKVCIEQLDDGTYSVYDESQSGEDIVAAESMPGMGAPAGKESQTAATVDEALNLARQMLQDDGRTEQEQMQAGYERGRPTGMMGAKPAGGGMTPAKVMGG